MNKEVSKSEKETYILLNLDKFTMEQKVNIASIVANCINEDNRCKYIKQKPMGVEILFKHIPEPAIDFIYRYCHVINDKINEN